MSNLSRRSLPPPPPLTVNSNKSASSDDSQDRTKWILISSLTIGTLLAVFVLVLLFREAGLGEADSDTFSAGDSSQVDVGRLDGPQESSETASGSESIEERTNNNSPNVKADAGSPSVAPDEQSVAQADTSAKPEQVETGGNEDLEPSKSPMIGEYVGKAPQRRGGNIESESGVAAFLGDEPATSTVFIIDQSASMQSDNRWNRVVRSLSNAIGKLKADQSFTVICFSDFANPYNTPLKLVKATTPNKGKVKEWLSRQSILSGTNPRDALLNSLDLDAERIVLLSDGEFDPSIIAEVTERNQSKTQQCQINCVGLSEQVATLQELAKLNRGVYYQAQ